MGVREAHGIRPCRGLTQEELQANLHAILRFRSSFAMNILI